MNKKYLNPKVLAEYVEAICIEKHLPDTLKQAMVLQIQKLREIYGDSIPKDDFLTLFGKQQSALKTGYQKQPVDILEFLLSSEYLNLNGTIRPKIKSTLIDLFDNHPECYEVVLSGCIDLDAYIMENNGNLRKLGENISKFTNVSVCSKKNYCGASDGGLYSGIKEVCEITLKNGINLKLTPDHKIEIVRNGNFIWEEVKNVTPTDLVRCSRVWNVSPDISLGKEIGFVLGCWAADGYARATDARIATNNIDYLCCLKEILNKLGFDSYFEEHEHRDMTTLHVRKYKKSGFYDFIKKYDLMSPKCKTVKIPEEVLRSDDNTVISFIRGIWASDGGIHYYEDNKHAPCIKLSMVSEDFIRQMQLLLLRFGIQSHYRKEKINIKAKRPSVSYIINIYGAENQLKFCNLLEFIPGRTDRLKKIIEFHSTKIINSNIDVVPVTYNKLRDVLKSNGIKRPNKSKWVTLSTNCCTRMYPTYRTFNSFVEDFGYLTEVKELQAKIDPNSIYMKVKSVKFCNIAIPTGDIGVPGINKFIANGISVHNSTRIGKTYLTCAAFAYHVYKLSCLYSPQTHYKLSPGSEIVFSMQSLTEVKAKRNFNEFRGMVEGSDYFKKFFPLQGTAKNYSVFPNKIIVKPIASNNAAAMSENIFCAFIDEANFMQVIKGSAHQALDEQYYDQATKLYQTVKDRIQNQFKNFATGEWPGKLYLASSANHFDDFIQTKIKEAKKSKHIYVMDYALWEVKEDVNPSGDKFWVQMPTELDGGCIMYEKPDIMTNDIIEVPIELVDQFEADLHAAIRNVAGKPISRESKFIPSYILIDNIKMYNQYYQSNQMFTVQSVCLNDVVDMKSLLNIPFIRSINNYFTFHSHCDLAVSNDSAGIAFGATVGAKTLQSKETYDIDSGEKKIVAEAQAPIYALFGVLEIKPPKTGQIDINKVEEFYLTIAKELTNFNSFSADRAYSISLIQNLRRRCGVTTKYISVDRSIEPYVEFKNSLAGKRCWIPDHEKLKEELKNIYLDVEKNKVNHHLLFSKDVADACAGVVHVLSKRVATYKKTETPKTLTEIRKMAGEYDKKKDTQRTSYMNRPRSGNRSKNWQRRRI